MPGLQVIYWPGSIIMLKNKINKEWFESFSLSLSFSVLTQLLAPRRSQVTAAAWLTACNIHSRSHFPESFSALILMLTFKFTNQVSPNTHQEQICSVVSAEGLQPRVKTGWVIF